MKQQMERGAQISKSEANSNKISDAKLKVYVIRRKFPSGFQSYVCY